MSRPSVVLGVVAALLAGPAIAGSLYEPPAPGSPLYGNESMLFADMSFAAGTFGSLMGIAGSARAGFEFPGYTVMFDLSGISPGNFGGYAHLYKQFGRFTLGGFGGVGVINGPGTASAGVEAVFYPHPNLALSGTAALNIQTASGASAGSLSGYAAYYLTPGLMIRADAAYFHSTQPITAYSGTLAYQFPGFSHLIGTARLGVISQNNQNQTFFLLGATLLLDRPVPSLQDHNYKLPFQFDLIPGGF